VRGVVGLFGLLLLLLLYYAVGITVHVCNYM
jgi:hypothetical protein